MATDTERSSHKVYEKDQIGEVQIADEVVAIIAGLAAQEITLQEAAVCGVYLHGKAADISGIDIGLAAGELAQFLPEARHEVLKGN